ncbi:hypothetical protein predicted by Glimmer/Critica [Limosilactobacillus fermentum]|nr:hypothetical protein predicted by Glimmer/Critica [Limosilactobacillus fermentum]
MNQFSCGFITTPFQTRIGFLIQKKSPSLTCGQPAFL